MKHIAVIGAGYVGLANAIVLAQHNCVTAVDVNAEKVDMLNRRVSPLADEGIRDHLENRELDLTATTDMVSACRNADHIVISVPTDYDPDKDRFDTSVVDSVLAQVTRINPDAVVIIKSTVPIGYTMLARERFQNNNILFSPEFLREGKALYDNLNPSRIIVGVPTKDERLAEAARGFAELMKQGADKTDIPIMIIEPTEAEAVKLFANTYLAMRVAFFNELDSFAETYELNARQIIEGIGYDPRIGNYYNNPSFGYGGYCLPKDTKQLLANYRGVSNDIIRAVVEANQTRKEFIAGSILKRIGYPDRSDKNYTVGIYRLTMKSGSDNFRQSGIRGVMEHLQRKGVRMVVYEPTVQEQHFWGGEVIRDLAEFIEISEIIVANRYHPELDSVREKVYTRDIYFCD